MSLFTDKAGLNWGRKCIYMYIASIYSAFLNIWSVSDTGACIQWDAGIKTACRPCKSGLNSGVVSILSHISHWDFWLRGLGVYPFEGHILNIFTIV